MGNTMHKTVLIVEDEQVLRDVYTMVLVSKGFTVFSAINGLEGLQKLKELQPNVVLLDIMMPVMDGREFMRNVDLHDYPQTTILAYSNMSDRDLENEMITLGASKFILKSSMTPNDLVKLVTNA